MPVLGITGSIATGKSTFAQRLKRRLEAEFFDADAVARELLESDPAVQREILSVFGPDVAGPDGAIDRARLRSIIFGPKGSQAALQQRSPEDTVPSGQALSSQAMTGAGAEAIDRTTGKVAGDSAASTEKGQGGDDDQGSTQVGERPQAASGTEAFETAATGTKEIGDRVNVSPTPKEQLEAILHPRIRARWKELAAAYRSTRPGPQRWLLIDIPLLFETGAEGAFDVIAVVACGAQTQQHRLRERGLDPEVAQAIIASQLDLATKMKRASHIIWSESSLTFLDEQAALLAAHLQQRYG